MAKIPFLRPQLPKLAEYERYLHEMDERRWYTNFGVLNSQFEQRVLKEYFQDRGAVTTLQNCTLGLMLAINHMKRPGAKFALMPSFTFAATPQAAMWCGLEPWFVDIDPQGWHMDADKLKQAVNTLGDQVAAVVTYATFGSVIDTKPYEALMARGIPVIIDAAPGFGSSLEGKQFGADFPGAVIFSFHATKAFGIGEGGLIYSANTDLIKALRRDSNFAFSQPGYAEGLGMNAKMPEIAAAVALATLDRFPAKLACRRELYQAYLTQAEQQGLLRDGWQTQDLHGKVPSQFFALLAPSVAHADTLMQELTAAETEYRRYFQPHCQQQPAFARFAHDGLPITDDIAARIISLPLWEGMTTSDVSQVIACVVRAHQRCPQTARLATARA